METKEKIMLVGAGGVAAYILVPPFKNIVDSFIKGFREGWNAATISRSPPIY